MFCAVCHLQPLNVGIREHRAGVAWAQSLAIGRHACKCNGSSAIGRLPVVVERQGEHASRRALHQWTVGRFVA